MLLKTFLNKVFFAILLTTLSFTLFIWGCSYEKANENKSPQSTQNLGSNKHPEDRSQQQTFPKQNIAMDIQPPSQEQTNINTSMTEHNSDVKSTKTTSFSKIEESLEKSGLIDIQTVHPDILVDLKYASESNFLETNLYGDVKRAFLQPEPAAMLAKAQEILAATHPYYRLLVYDAARPRSVQRLMYAHAKANGKEKYVAEPYPGSAHNYGAAVDLTIADSLGQSIDMGTPYDFFGTLAQPRFEAQFLAEGKLTHAQIINRLLLRNTMKKAGFIAIQSEWWHFEAYPKTIYRAKYPIIE
jgi:D-alanyl-D-alanine dipeptidase